MQYGVKVFSGKVKAQEGKRFFWRKVWFWCFDVTACLEKIHRIIVAPPREKNISCYVGSVFLLPKNQLATVGKKWLTARNVQF